MTGRLTASGAPQEGWAGTGLPENFRTPANQRTTAKEVVARRMEAFVHDFHLAETQGEGLARFTAIPFGVGFVAMVIASLSNLMKTPAKGGGIGIIDFVPSTVALLILLGVPVFGIYAAVKFHGLLRGVCLTAVGLSFFVLTLVYLIIDGIYVYDHIQLFIPLAMVCYGAGAATMTMPHVGWIRGTAATAGLLFFGIILYSFIQIGNQPGGGMAMMVMSPLLMGLAVILGAPGILAVINNWAENQTIAKATPISFWAVWVGGIPFFMMVKGAPVGAVIAVIIVLTAIMGALFTAGAGIRDLLVFAQQRHHVETHFEGQWPVFQFRNGTPLWIPNFLRHVPKAPTVPGVPFADAQSSPEAQGAPAGAGLPNRFTPPPPGARGQSTPPPLAQVPQPKPPSEVLSKEEALTKLKRQYKLGILSKTEYHERRQQVEGDE